MTRREISPALLGSIALHALVAALLLISWRWTRDLKLGSAVPVTIVANGPASEPPEAVQAPETQAAQAEQPTPQAPPQPTPPAPQVPAPPQPQPAPAPAKAEHAPTPKPAKAAEKAPAKTEKSLDLDALAASLSKMSKAGGKAAAANKGPSKAATAPVTGHANSAAAAAAVNGMQEEVGRRWNPNCQVAGGRDVQVSVFFRLDSAGQVMGDVRSQIRSTPNEVARAAADRAVRAVYAAAPFRNLPRELYGQNFKLNFDAKDACP